jgi:hypothetical protein
LARGGTRRSDRALINTADKDDIFSLIEVPRGDTLPGWKTAAHQPAVRPIAGAADHPTRASKREERRKAKNQ